MYNNTNWFMLQHFILIFTVYSGTLVRHLVFSGYDSHYIFRSFKLRIIFIVIYQNVTIGIAENWEGNNDHINISSGILTPIY